MTSDSPAASTPEDSDGASSGPAAARGPGRRRAFMVGGVAVGTVALVVAAFAVFGKDASGPPAQAEGAALTDEELIQLDSLLAELPDDQSARSDRARQLMAAGDYDGAMAQYLAVLDDGPDAEALAAIGWITYDSGDPALAQHLLEQSLVVDPDYLTAIWFLANVKFFGTEDVAGAVSLLEQVVGRADAEPDMIEAAREMLATAAGAATQP